MAEPIHYPSLDAEKPKDEEVTKTHIGFEGLGEEEDRKASSVEKQEEIELLPPGETNRRPKASSRKSIMTQLTTV